MRRWTWTQWDARVAWGLALGMGGVAVLVVASTLFHLAGSGWQGPVVDAWRFLPVVRAYHSGEAWLSRLFAPHGAHVLFFPRLLHLVDYAFFSGRNVFLVVCGVLLQTLNALALIAVVYRSRRLSGSAKTFAGALCLALLFSATQLENFARGWNVHWFLALFGVLAAALSLARGAETAAASGRSGAAWGWLLCSLASASLASLSMANGLLAWPLGIALAVRTRAPASWSLLYAATGFLFGMAYWGSGAASAETLSASAAWAGLARWMALCLGAPLSWTSPNAGMLLGSGGALAGALLAGLRLVSERPWERLEAAGTALVVYGLGSCAMAALGRTGGAAFELWAARRYQGFGLALWLGLFLLLFGERARRDGAWATSRALPLAIASLWVCAVLLPAQLPEARAVERWASRARAANQAIVVGIPYRPLYRPFLPAALRPGRDPALRNARFLREHDLGMFAGPVDSYLGRRIDGDLRRSSEPNACLGEVASLQRVGGDSQLGWRLSGWAWDARRRAPPSRLLISGRAGRVVGIGAPLERSLRPTASLGERERLRWTGYARGPESEDGMRVWVLLDDDSVCPIPGMRAAAEAGD